MTNERQASPGQLLKSCLNDRFFGNPSIVSVALHIRMTNNRSICLSVSSPPTILQSQMHGSLTFEAKSSRGGSKRFFCIPCLISSLFVIYA